MFLFSLLQKISTHNLADLDEEKSDVDPEDSVSNVGTNKVVQSSLLKEGNIGEPSLKNEINEEMHKAIQDVSDMNAVSVSKLTAHTLC